jgi:hypothetical protein
MKFIIRTKYNFVEIIMLYSKLFEVYVNILQSFKQFTLNYCKITLVRALRDEVSRFNWHWNPLGMRKGACAIGNRDTSVS